MLSKIRWKPLNQKVSQPNVGAVLASDKGLRPSSPRSAMSLIFSSYRDNRTHRSKSPETHIFLTAPTVRGRTPKIRSLESLVEENWPLGHNQFLHPCGTPEISNQHTGVLVTASWGQQGNGSHACRTWTLSTLSQNLGNNNSNNNGLWAGSTGLWSGAMAEDLKIKWGIFFNTVDSRLCPKAGSFGL